MVKFRNAGSYYGNTPEAIKNQRANLIPGSKYYKREIQEMKLNCWWEGADLETKQWIYEGYENNKDIENVPKEELKSENDLDTWWGELELGDKKYIYKVIMKELPKENKARIFRNIEECLKEKLALEKV